ncbi:MAG: NAD(+) synthase [Flavobacteriia bacterium]
MNPIVSHIVAWLKEYQEKAKVDGYIIGVSGGVDSALTSTLCAMTGAKVILLNMPIRQTSAEYKRAQEHIQDLTERFSNVNAFEIPLTDMFATFESLMPFQTKDQSLAMANSRSRLRMTTLYAVGQANRCLVAGTGNRVEDFGVGFFTKYGDGGVDVSPIADLTKTEVFQLAESVNIVNSILTAAPTDGLWEDGRSDEDQIGATYPELEWAMDYRGDGTELTVREKEVLRIYQGFHSANKHKMEPIPVCLIPRELKNA